MPLITNIGELPTGRTELRKALEKSWGIDILIQLKDSGSVDRYDLCEFFGVDFEKYETSRDKDPESWIIFMTWFHRALRYLRRRLKECEEPMLIIIPAKADENERLCYLVKLRGETAAAWLAVKTSEEVAASSRRIGTDFETFFSINSRILEGLDETTSLKMQEAMLGAANTMKSAGVSLEGFISRELKALPDVTNLIRGKARLE